MRQMAIDMLSGVAVDQVPAWRWIANSFMVMDTDTLKPVPYVVFPWKARILMDLLPEGDALPYQLALLSTIKKSGKSTDNAAITANLMFNRAPDGAEMYALANSKEQATSRVFRMVKYAVEHNPRLMDQCRGDPLETIIRLTNGTFLQGLAAMHMNIAGGNPYLSVWTELWGYEHERELRAWHEMTPPPTIANALRVVDTYAGYEGESSLLNGLEDQAKAGTRLYVEGYDLPEEYRDYAEGVLAAHPDWREIMLPDNETGASGATGPLRYDTPLPVYVEPDARLYAYWDEGLAARRLPWQRGERGRRYYMAQAKEMQTLPGMFTRLHENRRAKRGGQFVGAAVWGELPRCEPWQLGDIDAIVLAADAAMFDDHMALVGVRVRDQIPEECYVKEWIPEPDERADGRPTVDPEDVRTEVLRLRDAGMNILAVAYDPFQFHSIGLAMVDDGFTTIPFPQGPRRLEADTLLASLIRDSKLAHTRNEALRVAVENANALPEKGKTGDEKRLRIVKGVGKVDPLVALSMAVWTALQPPPTKSGAMAVVGASLLGSVATDRSGPRRLPGRSSGGGASRYRRVNR